MFSHVEQALAHLNAALDEVETAPSDLLRRALGVSKALRSRVEVLETRVAAVVAQRERHGDGGAGLLREHSGLSRSDAARNVRTDAEMAAIPDAHAAVTDGKISLVNAARLADAARKVSPDAVQDDPELIGLAEKLPADEFALAAQRWTARHRHADDLAWQHRRNRRNRNVRFWNGDDGSMQMRGSFDAEMGARIQERLRRHAEQLRQADRRLSAGSHADSGSSAHNSGDAGAATRTTDQRMADALDALLAAATAPGTPTTETRHEGVAMAAGHGTQPADSTAAAGDHGSQSDYPTLPGSDAAHARGIGEAANVKTDGGSHPEPATAGPAMAGVMPPTPVRGKTAAAEIIVRADLPLLLGELDGLGSLAEICGVGPIPTATVERLACNSDVWLEIFGDKLTPLYETVASRAPTASQRRALVARDGACIGCGAPPGDCEAHHIIPVACRGKTRLDNLVLVCWSCHDRIHDHNWQVVIREGRYRIIPPDPARPLNPAPSRKPKRRAPYRTPLQELSQEPLLAMPEQPQPAA